MNDDYKKLITIVIPVFNEEENIEPCYRKLKEIFAKLDDRYHFEIIFTDNHSTDETIDRIAGLAAIDGRVRAYRFSRNFGYQRSILTGYQNAHGDAAIQLDVDLQDPPEMIEKFLSYWEEGYKVVYGVRAQRSENALINLARKCFYRIIDVLSDVDLPHDAGDFRLLDRRILVELSRVNDARPYLRGLVAELGFRQKGVPYDRRSRERGKSKFNFLALRELAMDGIVGHSTALLRLATFTGVIVFCLAAVGLFGYLITRLAGANWPAGFATTTLLLLLGIGLNAIFLGIIGEYVGRIYLEVRKRPTTVVERVIGETEETR